MIYQCTVDMIKALKVEPSDKPDIYNAVYAWNVKVLKVNRRNLVYLMNNASKLSIILYGMTAKKFKDFDDHVRLGVRTILKDCGVETPIIERYIEETVRQSLPPEEPESNWGY